jgi:phosphohistidine swiveling domain-containing protein
LPREPIDKEGQMAAYFGLNEFEFQDDDLKNYTVWICNLVHGYPPWTPLFAWAHHTAISDGFQYAAETLSIPETKGWAWRIIDGYAYIAVIEPRPEEVSEREEKFRERIIPYIENWDEMWNGEIAAWLPVLKAFQEFDVEHATNAELYMYFKRYMVQLFHEMWKKHMLWMYPAFSLAIRFRTACQELTGITPQDPLFKKLMAGFDNLMVRFNRGLWGLGDRAKELGLDTIFLTTEDDEEVLRKLEVIEGGRKWLEEYQAWVKVHGWRCNRAEEWSVPSWIEKPSSGIAMIRQGIAKGGVFVADQEFERLKAERQDAEKGILAKVPEGERVWFEKLMRCAQRSGVFSEDHNYYFEMPAMALGRHVTRELGKRLAQAGVIDRPDDIYMLMPGEMGKAAIAMERANLRPYAEKRREEWERAFKIEPQPFIGNVQALGEMARKDPIVGVIAEPPMVRPELKADLYGAASAPGIVEGIARIIADEAHLGEFQAGEVLVAKATFPGWTPLFNTAAAVVTDAGGQVAHAVIVGREYGIPVVAGTLEATMKIKTGMRVRVDGNEAVVYIV